MPAAAAMVARFPVWERPGRVLISSQNGLPSAVMMKSEREYPVQARTLCAVSVAVVIASSVALGSAAGHR